MKLHTDNSEIERIGIQQESTFTIKTTAKAFDILSSGLYSDKILAVVRELSCNAYDAQVAAGKGKEPFNIHLPNSLEPYFSVRDNGCGLSDDQIHGLYTTYFDSTKTDSNDFIGALGLGSKSPFSYSKAFEVISRYDGMIRMYSIFINEDGIPSVACMSEKETDECNGLEVKLTIDKADFNTFEDKVQTALRFFELKPIITGNRYFEWKYANEKEILGGKFWKMFESNWNTRGEPIGIQGNVPYKIDVDLLDNLASNEKYFIKNTRVIMDFDIGDLEVAASREGLQYDDTTKDNIRKRIQTVIKEVQKSIRKEVTKHKDSYWNLVIALNSYSSLIFKDRDTLCEIIDAKNVRSVMLRKYANEKGRIDKSFLEGHEMIAYTHNYNSRPTRGSSHRYITPNKNTVIMINDLRIGGIQRMHNWLQQNHNKKIYAIKQIKWQNNDLSRPIEPAKVKPFNYEKELEKLLKLFVGATIIKVSDLPAVPRASGAVSNGEIQLYKGEEAYRYPYKPKWVRTSVNIEDGGFYYTLKNRREIVDTDGRCYNQSSNNHDDKVHKLLSIIKHHSKQLGIDFDSMNNNNIYGANVRAKKMIVEAGNWYDVYELLDKIKHRYYQTHLFARKWENTRERMEFTKMLENEHFVELITKMPKDYPLRQMFFPLIGKLKRLSEKEYYINILRETRRLSSTTDDVLIDNISFREKYPMLKYVSNYSRLDSHEVKDVLDYITHIDKLEENE